VSVAASWSVLQCVAACCSVFAVLPHRFRMFDMVLQCECGIVLQCVASCCSAFGVSSSPAYDSHGFAL